MARRIERQRNRRAGEPYAQLVAHRRAETCRDTSLARRIADSRADGVSQIGGPTPKRSCESGKNVIIGAASCRLFMATEYWLGAILGFSLFFNKEKETHVY